MVGSCGRCGEKANERLPHPICKESDAGALTAQSVLVLSSLVMFTQGEKVGGHLPCFLLQCRVSRKKDTLEFPLPNT